MTLLKYNTSIRQTPWSVMLTGVEIVSIPRIEGSRLARALCVLDVAHFLTTSFLLLLIAPLTPIIIAFMHDQALC